MIHQSTEDCNANKINPGASLQCSKINMEFKWHPSTEARLTCNLNYVEDLNAM